MTDPTQPGARSAAVTAVGILTIFIGGMFLVLGLCMIGLAVFVAIDKLLQADRFPGGTGGEFEWPLCTGFSGFCLAGYGLLPITAGHDVWLRRRRGRRLLLVLNSFHSLMAFCPAIGGVVALVTRSDKFPLAFGIPALFFFAYCLLVFVVLLRRKHAVEFTR